MKNLLRPQMAVRWLPWSAVAFERARAEGKVMLLSLDTAWSRACRDMDAQCYADHAIAEKINTQPSISDEKSRQVLFGQDKTTVR